MRKLTICLFAVSLVAGVAFGGVYEGYEDWQWQPVHVVDTNASENVRFEIDMTVPVHGPWLTLPSESAMTVTWITRIPCAGGIEYWEKGTTNRLERWPVRSGLLDCSREIQSFRLTGLKPGTTYEYRILSYADKFTTPWTYYVGRGRETYSFRTVDPNRDTYRVFLTSDLHGGARLSLTPMFERTGAKDADYYFFLGDNVSDGAYNNYRFYVTMGFLDDVTRLWGKEKASIFLRGNHDISGPDAIRHGELFPQPGDKTYYAFRQGPCYFVTMDTLWPPKEVLAKRQFEAYLREQMDWFKALKTTEEWKTATFRIVMFHVPIFPSHTDFVADYFGEELLDETPEGKVHAVIAGHEHTYARLNPNTQESRVNNTYGKIPARFPFVSIVCHTGEAMTIDVSPAKLVFKSHRYWKREGGFFDAFEITAEGQINDLPDTTVCPLANMK